MYRWGISKTNWLVRMRSYFCYYLETNSLKKSVFCVNWHPPTHSFLNATLLCIQIPGFCYNIVSCNLCANKNKTLRRHNNHLSWKPVCCSKHEVFVPWYKVQKYVTGMQIDWQTQRHCLKYYRAVHHQKSPEYVIFRLNSCTMLP